MPHILFATGRHSWIVVFFNPSMSCNRLFKKVYYLLWLVNTYASLFTVNQNTSMIISTAEDKLKCSLKYNSKLPRPPKEPSFFKTTHIWTKWKCTWEDWFLKIFFGPRCMGHNNVQNLAPPPFEIIWTSLPHMHS